MCPTIELQPDSGTRLIAVSECVGDRHQPQQWFPPEEVAPGDGENAPPAWLRFGVFTRSDTLWHVVAAETTLGGNEDGIRLPAFSDDEKPAKYAADRIGRLTDTTCEFTCPRCNQTVEIEISWDKDQDGGVTCFDLVVDLGTSRSSAVLVNCSSPAQAVNLGERILPLCFWPEGHSGDTVDEQTFSDTQDISKVLQYSVTPSLCLLHPNSFEEESTIRESLRHTRSLTTGGTEGAEKKVLMRPHMFLQGSPLLVRPHSSTSREQWSTWSRLNQLQHGQQGERSILSSPKRFVGVKDIDTWRNVPGSDSSTCPFIARLMHGEGAEYDYGRSGEEEVLLPSFSREKGWKLPRSEALVWYCLTVLEEAWKQINTDWKRDEIYGAGVIEDKRRLREVVTTFPPGWPREAREFYRGAWERAIYLFKLLHLPESREARNEPSHPRLSTESCDEAFAAQFPLITPLLEGAGWDEDKLLELLGCGRDRDEFNVMTLDVGGGTFDISICKYGFGGNQGAAGMETEIKFSHSSTRAGDDVIWHLLQEVILPAVIQGEPGLGAQDREEMFDILRDPGGHFATPINRQRYEREAYMVFPPLACLVLEKLRNHGDDKDDTITVNQLNTDSRQNISDIQCISQLLPNNTITNAVISLNAEDIVRVVEDTLRPNLVYAADLIVEQNVDLVVLNGKLMEIPEIVDVVKRHLPLMRARILHPRDAQVNQWFPSLWTSDGCIEDTKCLVATGAALVHMFKQDGEPDVAWETPRSIQFEGEQKAKYVWILYDANGAELKKLIDPDGDAPMTFPLRWRDDEDGKVLKCEDDSWYFANGEGHLFIGRRAVSDTKQRPCPSTNCTGFVDIYSAECKCSEEDCGAEMGSYRVEPIYRLTMTSEEEVEATLKFTRKPEGEGFELVHSPTGMELVLDMVGEGKYWHETMAFPTLTL